MTNKEFREALSLFPDDAQIIVWNEKDDMDGFSCGWYNVNCISEGTKNSNGETQIKVAHLFKNEMPCLKSIESCHAKTYIVGSNGEHVTNIKKKES